MLPRRTMVVWGMTFWGLLVSGCQVTVPVRSTNIQPLEPEESMAVASNKTVLKPRSVLPSAGTGALSGRTTGAVGTTKPALAPSGEGALAASGAGAEAGAEAPSVRVVQALKGLKLAPLLGTDGQVSQLLLEPDDPLLRCELAIDGAGALAVAHVKLRIEEQARRPALEASSAPVEGGAPGPTAEPSPAEPVEVELTPADLGWAATWTAGKPQRLSFSVRHPALLKFLADHRETAQLGLTLTPVGAEGQLLPLKAGSELKLSCTLQVL